MSVENWRQCLKQKTGDGLPFPDAKLKCALKLGANISTDTIDSSTWNKITDLHDSELENRVIARLLNYPHFSFNFTVEMAKKDMVLDAQLKIDTQKIYEDSRKAIETEKRKIAGDQAEQETMDQQETRRQIDSQIERLKKANEPEPMKPHVIERTFCGFCSEFHATKILLSDGSTREYSINTWHSRDYMKVDSEGWETKQPSNYDRCVYALTVNKGIAEDEAKTKCTAMLEDPMFLHNFINFPIKSGVTKPSKEDYAVGKLVAEMNIHPEMAKALYDKDRQDNAEYINKLTETGELHKMLARRRH
jgi:hypothetical protein